MKPWIQALQGKSVNNSVIEKLFGEICFQGGM